jgi:hypothetical protein
MSQLEFQIRINIAYIFCPFIVISWYFTVQACNGRENQGEGQAWVKKSKKIEG